MTAKTILGIVPGLQATSLVMHNVKNLPSFNVRGRGKCGKTRAYDGSGRGVGKQIRTGIGTIVGVGLIIPTSKMINAL